MSQRDLHGKWGISTDDELYDGWFETREDAIEQAPNERDLEPGDRFSVGRFERAEAVVSRGAVDRLCEDVNEATGEDAHPDYDFDWPNPTKEQIEALRARIAALLVEVLGPPPLFGVKDVSEHSA